MKPGDMVHVVSAITVGSKHFRKTVGHGILIADTSTAYYENVDVNVTRPYDIMLVDGRILDGWCNTWGIEPWA